MSTDRTNGLKMAVYSYSGILLNSKHEQLPVHAMTCMNLKQQMLVKEAWGRDCIREPSGRIGVFPVLS